MAVDRCLDANDIHFLNDTPWGEQMKLIQNHWDTDTLDIELLVHDVCRIDNYKRLRMRSQVENSRTRRSNNRLYKNEEGKSVP